MVDLPIREIKQISRIFERMKLPGRDLYEIPTSEKRFPDGCQYRFEVSAVERLSAVEAVIDEMKKRERAIVHRILASSLGTTYLTDDELSGIARAAHDAELGVVMCPGPNADIGAAQNKTAEGAIVGNRFRGMDQLAYVIADIKRCIKFGFRAFLVTDEGELSVLNEMRKMGDIPKDVQFKWSMLAGTANPAGARIIESLGADSFNPRADLTLPILGHQKDH